MSFVDLLTYVAQFVTDPFGVIWYIVYHVSASLNFAMSLPNDLYGSVITNMTSILSLVGDVITGTMGAFLYAGWLTIIGIQVLIVVFFSILGALKRIPGL